MPVRLAIDSILAIAGYTAVLQDSILSITSISADHKVSSLAQGRVVQVFRLDYTSATDVNLIIKGLLTPAGQSFVSLARDNDNRKTQEVLVVEDVPSNMERLARTVQQLDVAPRQVLIEAHILSVTLSDDTQCGINLQALVNNPAVTLRTDGFSNAAAFATPGTSQAFFFNLAWNNVNALITALQTTANAKTLASPKVFAVNGQKARIQIGSQLGYKTTTTTQTSTMESVSFLNTGIILTVTPQITPDNQVLMTVKPEVSTGQIDQATSLPDSTTTQVETSVLLRDGYGIVIGGLIQETDTEGQSKVPFFGDLWLVGWLFQHRETNRSRNEVIISLVPHIVPYQPACAARDSQEFCHSATPLLQGPLERVPRPWEPGLPNAGQRRPLFFGRNADYDAAVPVNPQGGPCVQKMEPVRREGSPVSVETIAAPPSRPAPAEGTALPPAPQPAVSP